MGQVQTLNEFSRTELLLGAEGMRRLHNARVAVFGVGGVGSFAVEALIRSGIGSIDLFDSDNVSLTNINRQLIATRKTIGKKKVEVMRDRILEINPSANVDAHDIFYGADNASDYDLSIYDYIIDAIDTVSSKLVLIESAKTQNVPIISSMGAGNKLDPTKLEVADITKTSMCPLAKVMRYELRKRGIQDLKVVYSKETPIKPAIDESKNKQVPGSVAFVPSVAGLILAGEVIKYLAITEHNEK
ncbi:MAG: tRNA threonylcarbamoyladenosine dehydratase [Eubacteriales bacterium]|nr:tRNA threonylcarbamoyladenosine dehydratase [Eubacteriales bacterium]MDD3199578.1 tRNA threonylcarbamoyladenosine dehydratase [Eubacteriales bacterium]MDD4629290.1 tRNA threonylcarbamoyladenosine dehydratase [Eubacteriales bacterium]